MLRDFSIFSSSDSEDDIYETKHQQWCTEYLKQFRLCLVNESELFHAFQSVNNLKNTVTQAELINSLTLNYHQQIKDEFTIIKNRPTTIKVAINFLSMPIEISPFYDTEIMKYSDANDESIKLKEKFIKLKKDCLKMIEDCASKELELFYDRFKANIGNYLYHAITNNFPGSTGLLIEATITREDLEILRGRLKNPSTNLENKNDLIEIINVKIEGMPLQEDDQQEIVVIHRSKKSGKK